MGKPVRHLNPVRRTKGPLGTSYRFWIPVAAAAILLGGCVKRTIVIESNPPGAKVWINQRLAGVTPLSAEFITHGRYHFRLEKTGFRALEAREMVRAPVYQWIPLDFFFEYLIPFHLEDRHAFGYALAPQAPEEHLKVEGPDAVQGILADLNSPDAEKRRLASVALARRRDPEAASVLLPATHDPVPTVRASALSAWRAVRGGESLERLTEALRYDPNPEVRWAAAAELEALDDPQAVPALIEALRDRDPLPRAGAAEALKSFADGRSRDPLIRALRDEDTSVRRAAAEGLGKIGDRAAVRPLTRALFHQDFQTRRRAAKSLSQLKDPAAAPALVKTFTNWDPELRRTATEAVIQFGGAQVVPLLIRYLRSWQPWTREHAAQALGGLKDPRAIEPLTRAFRRESDPPASRAMLAALKSLGAKLDESWEQLDLWREQESERRRREQEKRQEREKL